MTIRTVHEFDKESVELSSATFKALKEHFIGSSGEGGSRLELWIDSELRITTNAVPTTVQNMRSFCAGFFAARVGFPSLLH